MALRRPRPERAPRGRRADPHHTCKKLGIPARSYLRATLAKILAGEKDLTALLPETYAAARAEAAHAKAA
jgi:hypothetical protein